MFSPRFFSATAGLRFALVIAGIAALGCRWSSVTMAQSKSAAATAAAAAAVASAPAVPGTPPGPPPVEVPVREVVLFSSGVGFFQHEGTVRGDAAAELRFKTAQINDVLKSLVLQDLGGGRAGAVTYPSQDPLEKTLGSFQINLAENPSMGDLLNQLRGARVGISVGTENFDGTVLGVEQRTVARGKDDAAIERPFLNLVTGLGIRAVSLDEVRKLTLEDAGLQAELNKALAALAGARDQDKKPVALSFTGEGERQVRVGYVVETPVWKASYRLIFPEEPPAAAVDAGTGGAVGGAESGAAPAPAGAKTAVLQGWAIVENQTDNDWNGVKLSLVSGRPISFTQDLYQPLYVQRPEVRPELYSSLRPKTYEGGQRPDQPGPDRVNITGSFIPTAEGEADEATTVAGERRAMPRAVAPKFLSAPSGSMSIDAAAPSAPPPPPKPFDPAQSIATAAQTAQIGELFQYTVPGVTLPRQRSAMIPILNDPIEAEKLSIFNERTLAKYALNGARLKNTTADKKSLLQGPITVFEDGGRYAGDASLGDVPAGQSRLLSYGIDLQLTVDPKEGRGVPVIQTGRIVNGVLEVTWRRRANREYAAENKGERPKKLIIEHLRRGGEEWRLLDTPEPVETLPGIFRFETIVPAGKSAVFTVREETTDRHNFELVQAGNANNLVYYSKQGEIPPAVREALARAAAVQAAAAETERGMNERLAQVNTITQEQNRIRENIKTTDKTSPYSVRLLKKLDDQESQIEKLRVEAEALRVKLETQRRELAEQLKGFNAG